MTRLVKIGNWGCLAALLVSVAGCATQHSRGLDGPNAALAVGRLPSRIVPKRGADGIAGHPRPTGDSESGPVLAPVIVTVAHQTSGNEGPELIPVMVEGKDTPETLQAPLPSYTDSTTPAPKAGLTLDQVINACLIADPKIRGGLEFINQANADALTASLKPNPTFNINQTLLPLTRPFTVDAQGGPPQLDVGLAYPIDWFLFGKRAAAMQSSGLGVRVSEAEYADLVRQRVLEAATAYYDVLEAKALRDLARQDVENLKQIEALTQKAVDGGGRPQVELSRIRLDRLKSEQALRDAENAVVGANARLRALLGRADADPAFDVAGTLDDQQTAEPLPVEESLDIAQQNRPDLNALRWKVRQAQADTLVERRKAYPEITPVIGYTRQFQEKAIGFPDASSFGFGLDMTLPFCDRNQGNRAKAASIVAQNNYGLQAGVVALRAEVVQADQELRTAAANSRAVAGEQLKLAEQVRDSINKAYEAGGRPLIDVLDAQRNYRETYRLFINSRANYGRAAVKFNATLGKQVAP